MPDEPKAPAYQPPATVTIATTEIAAALRAERAAAFRAAAKLARAAAGAMRQRRAKPH
jgi:hypothetical protein